MDNQELNQELLAFFKALADANRLKIVGLLAREPYTVERLAAVLGLSESTTSHHLARLADVGLVSARAESYYNVYSLEKGAIERIAHRLLSQERLPGAEFAADLEAFDRKVLTNFILPDGRIKTFPAQRKKFEAVLRYVVKAFEPGLRYTEHRVNEILARYHPDTATLRRELVDYGMLNREGGGGEYWRPVLEGGEPKEEKQHKGKKKGKKKESGD